MRGVVTFVFDDGYQEILDSVVPFLRKKKTPATFAVPTRNENLPQWLRIDRDLFELAAHGMTHTDFLKLDEKQLAEELAQPKTELRATTVVYPGGGHNDKVVTAARREYQAGRTTNWGFESLKPNDIMKLKTINWHKDNWSLLKANFFALWAAFAKVWLIETFHQVSSEKNDYHYTVPQKDFERHVKFVRRLPVKVKTIRDMIK